MTATNRKVTLTSVLISRKNNRVSEIFQSGRIKRTGPGLQRTQMPPKKNACSTPKNPFSSNNRNEETKDPLDSFLRAEEPKIPFDVCTQVHGLNVESCPKNFIEIIPCSTSERRGREEGMCKWEYTGRLIVQV